MQYPYYVQYTSETHAKINNSTILDAFMYGRFIGHSYLRFHFADCRSTKGLTTISSINTADTYLIVRFAAGGELKDGRTIILCKTIVAKGVSGAFLLRVAATTRHNRILGGYSLGTLQAGIEDPDSVRRVLQETMRANIHSGVERSGDLREEVKFTNDVGGRKVFR